MISHYTRLTKVKAMLDSDIDSIRDEREDSYVIQPRNSTGNPNVNEAGTPQNKTAGDDERDPRELPNKFYEDFGVTRVHPNAIVHLQKDFSQRKCRLICKSD